MRQALAVRVRNILRVMYVVIALVILAGDQGTKALVERSIPEHAVIPVIPHFLDFVHNTNPGAVFGLFADSPAAWKTALLVVASAALLVLVAVMVWKSQESSWESGVGLAMILGGAVSNLADRIRSGRVVDFIDVHVWGYHWFPFNVADSAIVVGAGLLILQMLLGSRRGPPV
jgi:signal peptidase II